MTTTTTIIQLLEERAKSYPNKKIFIFLKDGEQETANLTYEQLVIQSKILAKHLVNRNISNQPALLLFPQGLEFIVTLFACFYARVIAIPAYPPTRNKLNRLDNILANSEAKIVLSNQKTFNKSQKFASKLQDQDWLITDNLSPLKNVAFPKIDPSDIAFLQYTSGSTGQPKGVIISHRNIIANSEFLRVAFELSEQDTCVSWLPLFHDMGLIDGVIQPIYSNYPVYLMTPATFVQRPVTWLQALSKYKATRTGGPNFAYDLCVDKINDNDLEKLDLSKVTCLYNGSEPISAITLKKFIDKFRPAGLNEKVFYPCYGMAEATLQITGIEKETAPTILNLSKSHFGKNLVEINNNQINSISVVGCGYPRLDTQVKIVHPTTKNLTKSNEIGEIWIKGNSISNGYWNNTEITKENFNQVISNTKKTGYYRTGDLGFIHQNELFITGRIKELIIIRGRNYYPQDIEQIIRSAHPALQSNGTAAFSILEEKEKLIIVQEIKRTFIRDLKETEVFNAIKSKMAEHLDIAANAIVLVTPLSITKTTSGKLMRKECQVNYLKSNLSVIGIWKASKSPNQFTNNLKDKATTTETFLTQLFAQKSELPIEQITPNTSFLDIGIDSIYAIDLTVEIEKKLGVKITTSIFWELETIEKIALFIDKKVENDRLAPI